MMASDGSSCRGTTDVKSRFRQYAGATWVGKFRGWRELSTTVVLRQPPFRSQKKTLQNLFCKKSKKTSFSVFLGKKCILLAKKKMKTAFHRPRTHQQASQWGQVQGEEDHHTVAVGPRIVEVELDELHAGWFEHGVGRRPAECGCLPEKLANGQELLVDPLRYEVPKNFGFDRVKGDLRKY